MSKSKAELQAEILVINPSADVEGLTNKELTELLESLQPSETEHRVAKNRAIRCRKGLLVEGALVKPEYFANGMKDMDALIADGAIV